MSKIDYFSNDEVREGIRGKTIRGGSAVAIGQGLGVLIQIVSIPIITRLLSPDDFGIVAMTMVFTGFAHLFTDAGLSSAIIQREDLNHKQASNLFWIASLIGVVLTLLSLASAYPIGWVYGREDVIAVTAALSIPFAMSGVTIAPQALMRRVLRFEALTFIRLFSVLSGQGVAIGYALVWPSYWALVAGQLAQAGSAMLATCFLCHWRPTLPSRGVGSRSMVAFGASLSGAKLISYLSRSVDKFLIGSVLGSYVLGFYDRAHKLLLYPSQTINEPLTAVMLPVLSRLLNQPQKFAQAYFSATRAVMAVGVPIVIYMALDTERIVPLALGESWTPVVPIFRAMAPAALLSTFSSVAFAWVCIPYGRGIGYLKLQSVFGLFSILGFACGLPWGAVGVAAGFSISRLIVVPICVAFAYRDTPLTIDQLLKSLSPVFLSTLISASLTLLAKSSIPYLATQDLISITLLLLIMIVSYAASAYALGIRSLTVKPSSTLLTSP